MTKKRLHAVTALAAVALAGLMTAPVVSAEDGIGLLNSYIGNWQGEGALLGGEKPEPFRCRR